MQHLVITRFSLLCLPLIYPEDGDVLIRNVGLSLSYGAVTTSNPEHNNSIAGAQNIAK
jgi:hypothetical protein